MYPDLLGYWVAGLFKHRNPVLQDIELKIYFII